ncbi:unnamed protein product [Symbiodinium natans]|uniref:Uncharacterized protein n=1 Tax=Symbiodinium natans TaxID=878477 RepID=A0A812I971_9DINO|nr:unnamed protein product [Symbiodinium natans]
MSSWAKSAVFLHSLCLASGLRAEVFYNTSLPMPQCGDWYNSLPSTFLGFGSRKRQEYLNANPDPCAAGGLECCKGKCSMKGCKTDVSCSQCKSLLSDVPANLAKGFCEDSKSCNKVWHGCKFFAGSCESARQPCWKCTSFYRTESPEDAQAACEDRTLCYYPGNAHTHSDGYCKWTAEFRKCDVDEGSRVYRVP